MKRAKLMLTAIAVLTVVGGSLAFKANKKFSLTYCILTTQGNPNGGTCDDEISNSKFYDGGTVETFWYTTKTVGAACSSKDCSVLSTSFQAE